MCASLELCTHVLLLLPLNRVFFVHVFFQSFSKPAPAPLDKG